MNTVERYYNSNARSRSGVHELAPVLLVGGLVLAFVGLTDLALPYLTPHFGDAGWEFATISQTFESVPLPLLGLVLLALGARAVRSIIGLKVLSVFFAAGSLVATALLALFLLDIPVILQWLQEPSLESADVSAMRPWHDIGKPLVFAVTYIVSGVILTRLARRGARQIEMR